ncbi:MAG: Ca2+-binding protein toxin, partial [Rickettsiaceae bacterium]|nr:Ca2+-binding protein toxin [Rickettsiaceae bacterium]
MSNIVSRQTKHHQERSLEKVQLNQAAPVLTNTMDCDYSVVNQAFVGNDVNINATSCITDPDGDQLSWSVQDTSGSPHSWMNADAVTGLITGQIPDVGDYSAVAVATDPSGLSASQPFFVTGIPPFTAGELILNNSTDGDQAIVGVLTLDNGYVVARYGYVGVKWDQTWLQFLDLDGNTVRELQFDGSYDYVNSKESDYLGFSGFKLLPNGNFAASWIHASQELTQSGDEVGGLQAPFWRDRTFATLDNGLTVRLTDDPISNPDGTVHGIVGVQLFDSNNNAVSTKISPTINSSDGIASSDVLAIPGGKFIVSWMNQDGRDGSMYGSYSRLFSSALTNGEITPLGSDVLLNINTYKSQADGMVAFGSDGRVLAVWSSTYGPNGVKWSSTYGRIIDMSEFTALPSPSIAPSPSLAAPSPSPTPLPVPSPKSAPSTVSTSVVPSPTPLPVSSPSVASSSVAQSPSLVPSPVPSPVSPSVVPSPTPTPTPLPVPSPSAVSPSVVQSPSLAPSPVPSPVSPSVVPSPTPTPTPTPMPV